MPVWRVVHCVSQPLYDVKCLGQNHDSWWTLILIDTVHARAHRCAHSQWVGQELQNYTSQSEETQSCRVKARNSLECNGTLEQFELSDASNEEVRAFHVSDAATSAPCRLVDLQLPGNNLRTFSITRGDTIYENYKNDDERLHMSIFQVFGLCAFRSNLASIP